MRNRSDDKVSVTLIRHAKTQGNLLRRYIGATDESICDTACLNRDYPKCDAIVSSPMKRCVETAGAIYPDKPPLICVRLCECNFGDFENKSFEDLCGDARYIEWVKSNCELPIPNGESKSELIERSVAGFFETLPKNGSVAYVIHGGNIMAIMQSLFGGDFYDYHVENGGGFKFIMEGKTAYDYSSIGSV